MLESKFFSVLLLISVLLIGCTPGKDNQEQPEIKDKAFIQSHIRTGWNTWNNPNLLSFVHLPDGLALEISARRKRGWPYYLEQAYIVKPQMNIAEKITPIAHAYDGSYIEMELHFLGMKSSIRAASEGEDYFIHYRPMGEQDDINVLLLKASHLWNFPGTVLIKDSVMLAAGSGFNREIRSIGPEQNDMRLPVSDPYFSYWSDQEVFFYTGEKKSREQILQIMEEKAANYDENLKSYSDLQEAYEAMQNVVAWNVFYDANNDRAIASVSRIWNESWGGYIIFDWDTYFAGIMAGLDNKWLGYSNVLAITNAITPDGFIPNVSASWGRKSFDRSQPPVGSLCTRMLFEKYQDKWFLELVYDNLLTWNQWWARARDNQGYLSWGSIPGKEGPTGNEMGGTRRAAILESGLDNSPLFDQATYNQDKGVLGLASVGLMSLYISDCNDLAYLAEQLGKTDDAMQLKKRAEKYSEKLQTLWDEDLGIYRDKDLRSGEFTEHLAPTHFYPMLAEVPSQEQASRMVEEHLLNPEEFFGQYMMPSISKSDPAFSDNDYWRGRIWAPMNFLVYMGLRKYELPQAREALVRKSVDLILQSWKKENKVYENYNALSGAGDDVRNADPFYSWGGLLAFIALVENGYWYPPEK